MITGHLPELFLVLILGLIVFGPKRLPELGESLGKGIRSFKSGLASIGEEHVEPAPVAPIVQPIVLDRDVEKVS